MNWFAKDKWIEIEHTMKQHCNLLTTLHYLNLVDRYLHQINFISYYDYIYACDDFFFLHLSFLHYEKIGA